MTRDETINGHYVRNYKRLVKTATWRAPNKSSALGEEIVQEAYARAIKYYKAFNPDVNVFDAWFSRIFRGCIADCIRSEAGHSLPSLDNEDTDLEPFFLDEDVDIPLDIVKKVKAGINQQRPEVAEVLTMFFLLGMRHTDIAECTNISNDYSKKIIQRFRINWADENVFN